MEHFGNSAPDDKEKKSDSPEKKEDQFGGVVDELRNMLSGLNQEKPVPPVESASAFESSFEPKNNDAFVMGRSEFPADPTDDFSKPSTPAAVPSTPAVPLSELPTDNDFWNGNVLGWTDSKEEAPSPMSFDDPFSSKEPPPISMPEPIAPPSHDRLEEPKFEEVPGLEESPYLNESFTNAPPPPPPPPPPIPIQAPPKMKYTQETLNQLFPEPPDSPPPAPKSAEPPPLIHTETPNEPGFISSPLESFHVPEATPPAYEPPLKQERSPETPVDLRNLIPNDFDRSSNGNGNNGFELDAQNLKPDNIIHVACIVPENEQAKGQTFFSKLREAGRKAKKKLEIEAVFIHDWAGDRIDMEAWEKSALLSGADMMFIIAKKVDQAQFQELLNKPGQQALKKRLISLEQIDLRNLYADLLVQLSKGS